MGGEHMSNGLLVHPAWFRAYVGAMYTGKTNDFINEFQKIGVSNIGYQVFKPSLDDRFGETVIKSRAGGSIDCLAINAAAPEEIVDRLDKRTAVVGIDEMQFFDKRLVSVVEYLRERGLYVVGTMLDRDFRGESFGPSAELLTISDQIIKTTGVCMANNRSCPNPGVCTQRLLNGKPAPYNDPLVAIDRLGEGERTYELRCRAHHEVPGKPKGYKVVF